MYMYMYMYMYDVVSYPYLVNFIQCMHALYMCIVLITHFFLSH